MAIGMSVLFLIILFHSEIGNHLIWRIVFGLWILILALGAGYAYHKAHFGIMFCCTLMVIGAAVYHFDPPHANSFRRILYWGATLSVLCLIIGWASAVYWQVTWKWDKAEAAHLALIPLPPSMFVGYGPNPQTFEKDQIMFAGDKDILFFEYASRTTLLLRRDQIQLFECNEEVDRCVPPGWLQTH